MFPARPSVLSASVPACFRFVRPKGALFPLLFKTSTRGHGVCPYFFLHEKTPCAGVREYYWCIGSFHTPAGVSFSCPIVVDASFSINIFRGVPDSPPVFGACITLLLHPDSFLLVPPARFSNNRFWGLAISSVPRFFFHEERRRPSDSPSICMPVCPDSFHSFLSEAAGHPWRHLLCSSLLALSEPTKGRLGLTRLFSFPRSVPGMHPGIRPVCTVIWPSTWCHIYILNRVV